jgi:hypothetical protein
VNLLLARLATPAHGAFEPAPVPDPWGLGVTFFVRPTGAQELLAVRQKSATERVYQALRTERSRNTLGLLVGVKVDAAAPTGAAPTEPAVATEAEQRVRQLLVDAVLEAPEELLALLQGDPSPEEVVEHLLAGWEGVQNAEGEVPFSRAAALELLASTQRIEGGHAFAGEPVGRALCRALFAAGQEAGKHLGELGDLTRGNSGGSSAAGSGSRTLRPKNRAKLPTVPHGSAATTTSSQTGPSSPTSMP